MVVDGSRESAFGAFLADDEGVEVGFEKGRGYAGWGVGIAERALEQRLLDVLELNFKMNIDVTSVGPPGSYIPVKPWFEKSDR